MNDKHKRFRQHRIAMIMIVIDNRTGAGGIVGTETAARAGKRSKAA